MELRLRRMLFAAILCLLSAAAASPAAAQGDPEILITGVPGYGLDNPLSGVVDNVDPALHQVFVAGSVGTLLLTPFLMAAAPAFAGRLRGLGGAPRPPDERRCMLQMIVYDLVAVEHACDYSRHVHLLDFELTERE